MGLRETLSSGPILILDAVRSVFDQGYRERREAMLTAAKLHRDRHTTDVPFIQRMVAINTQLFILQALHPQGQLTRDYYDYLELKTKSTDPIELTFNEYRSLRTPQIVHAPKDWLV